MLAPLVSLALAALAPATSGTDSTSYLVLNHGRPAGEMRVVKSGDSVRVSYSYIDRNRGQRVESRYRLSTAGELLFGEGQSYSIDGQPQGPADRFELVKDSVRWSGRSTGSARVEPGTFFRMRVGTPWDQALVARWLLRQPGRSAKLYALTNGSARAEVVKELTVPTKAGRQKVRLVALHSAIGANALPSTPSAIWIDERGDLFASEVAWFITVKPGAEPALPALRQAEMAWRAEQAAAVAKRLERPAAGPIAITGADVFDSERGTLIPKATVVVRGGRIEAVGPDVQVPAGATVIDATGKTIVPGLWDMHTHLQLTSPTGSALMQLATGLTTVRDLASDTDVAVSIRDREKAGTVVTPRQILAGFIEGSGRWAGPSDVIVTSEAEARAAVARYDSLGYRQIKLYNIVHPDYVPAIAEEAKKRGLRLSGHVPRGLTVPAAVALGFDEINHSAFLFSTFFQDSLYFPRMRPYSAVAAAVAPSLNVDGPEMTGLIEYLKAKGTVIDGTFSLWARLPGTDSASAASIPAGNASWLRLIKRLYDAGVTMVAGTDNLTGSTYVTELELYEKAGIPAAKVLQIATLDAARVMKDDRDYGSIAAGKVADLVIVDGRPTERIADLRKVHRVVRAGRVYDPAELLAAAGVRR